MVVLLATVVFAATLTLLPREGFWINDNGCKLIQTLAAIHNDGLDLSIPWPGTAVDPELRWQPLADPFGYVVDGKLYGTFSATFTLLAALCYRLMGVWGLYALPVLGGIGTTIGAYQIARLCGTTGTTASLAALLVVLGTPVWFYSVTFWEHTPAVAAAVWATAFALHFVRKPHAGYLACAAVCSGLSVFFRDEMVLFAAALLAIVLMGCRHRLWWAAVFVVVFLISLLPLLAVQAHALSNALGHHAAAHTPFEAGWSAYWSDRLTSFRFILLNHHPHLVLSLVLGLPPVALLACYPRMDPRRFDGALSVVVFLGLAGGLLTLAAQVFTDRPIEALQYTNGLFAASPFLMIGLIRRRAPEAAASACIPAECSSNLNEAVTPPSHLDSSGHVFLWRIAALYTALYVLLTPGMHIGGIHFGARHLLPVYALLTVPAVINAAHWLMLRKHRTPVRPALLAGLVLLTMAVQVQGLIRLHARQSFSAACNSAVAAHDETVVIVYGSVGWAAAQDLAWCFYQKQIFLVRDEAEGDALMNHLREGGIRDVLLVEGFPGARAPQPGAQLILDQLNFTGVEIRRAVIGE